MKKNKKLTKTKRGILSQKKLSKLCLDIFKLYPLKPLNYKQLSKTLKLKGKGDKLILINVLSELEKNGLLTEISRGSYKICSISKTIITKVKKNNKGGIVVEINKEEHFINKEFCCFALEGDTVEVMFFPKSKKKIHAEITNVIKRKKTSFSGTIDNTSNNFFLVTDDKKVYFDLFLPPKIISKDFLDKKVLVNVSSWDKKNKNLVAGKIKMIGKKNDHDSEISSIIYDYGFSDTFSKECLRSLKDISSTISSAEIKKRFDIRSITTFTIDPEEAKDFDDALSIKKLSSKTWEVGVHIADVSHFVTEGSAIDKEALHRGTSVYLVDRVVPMLPEILSNDLCSLKPNVDRLTFSVFFEINENSEIINYKIGKSIIHSDYRFTYEKAEEILTKKSGVFYKELKLLNSFAKNLRKKREDKGSISFESKEVKFVLDDKNNPVDVYFKKPLSTHKLIEEFMLLANKTVGKHISLLKKPFVYRIHDVPDKESINSLNRVIKKFGYKLDKKNLSKSINNLLDKIKGKSEQTLIETLAIRSMAKALYSTNNIGHYGLSFDYYSHFTSPIRRYPDLMAHRLLYNYNLKEDVIDKDSLELNCKHCSDMEIAATKAERESIKYMQVKFLKQNVGGIYSGIISGVKEWGLYVELVENSCEGLVKINSIKDDHYFYDEKTFSLIGYRTKKTYQLGQKVKIKIKNADLEKKHLDFNLINLIVFVVSNSYNFI